MKHNSMSMKPNKKAQKDEDLKSEVLHEILILILGEVWLLGFGTRVPRFNQTFRRAFENVSTNI